MKVKKIDIWMGEIKDETGGLAAAVSAPLVATGVDFSFVIGTRRADKPGTGTVYFGGLRGAKQAKAAELAGFVKSDETRTAFASSPTSRACCTAWRASWPEPASTCGAFPPR